MSTNHFRARVGSIHQGLTAILLSFLFAGSANALAFTWDPGAVGLTGGVAFSADALKATEVSRITFTGPTQWTEHGYAKITGVLNDGVQSTPSGLNSSYTLYFDFSGTGDLATGHFSTASMTLYGVNGVSTFGIDGSTNAFVTNSGTAIALATNTLIDGTTGQAGADLFANLLTMFAATPSGAPMFLSPGLPRLFNGQFYHAFSEPGGVTFLANGIVLNGGDDTLYFVPEPASLLLLAGGLPGLLLFRRRK